MLFFAVFSEQPVLVDNEGSITTINAKKEMSHIISEDFPEIIPEKQYPKVQSIYSTKQWKENWKCILLTISIVACIILAYWCHQEITNQGIWRKDVSCNENTRWLLILTTIILYSLYLMECSHATDNMPLCSSHTENIQIVKEKIDDMKNALPIIWWKATCYHYERRKRRTTQYRRGTYFVATRIYQERVNTVSASSNFNYTHCGMKDISNSLLVNKNCRPVIKFKFSKGFAFANMAAATEFEAQRSAFFQELQRYDEYMEVHEGLDFTDYSAFQEEKIVLNTAGRRPWFANPFYYWLYSCFLLSWPFRVVLFYNTAHVHYKITKLFGTNYSSSSVTSVPNLYNPYLINDQHDEELTPLSAGISNASTSDLLMNNLAMAPSYSEALLIDNQQSGNSVSSLFDISNKNLHNLNDSSNSTIDDIDGESIIIGRAVATLAPVPNFNSGALTTIAPIAATTAVDQPPSYEEALMFPVVEPSRITEASGNSIADSHEQQLLLNNLHSPGRIGQSSLTSEMRLSNCRTFLSIETSL